MTKLKELFSIVSSLNEDEVKTLQRYLHCFDTVNESHEPKGERLLNLIIHNNAAELKLFEKKFTKPAFSMLVLRLYDKVLDTLTFDVNIKRADSYSDIGIARMTVRKRILYTQALGAKKQFLENISLYQKIIHTSKEFEFYDELLIAMYELQNLYGAMSKLADYENVDKEIQHYEEVRLQVKKAFQIYNKFMLEKSLNPENGELVNELELVLPKLKTFFLLSKSAQAGWFYYRLLIEYHQIKENYAEGHAACLALLKLQQENAAIKADSYFAITYKMMAKFSMLLYNFDEALVSILKCQNLDNKFKQNIDSGKETEFFANFYRDQYYDAKFIVNDLAEKSTQTEGSGFAYSKYSYYSACCAFLKGKHSDVYKNLAETKEIEKDKEGWNIAVRILGIMNQIENEDFDLADSRIESMRKHIERTMKEKDIRPRFVIILRILRDLMNSAFDFKQIWETRQNYFTLLADDTDETHRWRILSPELVRFDVWFEAKATDRTYQDVNKERLEGKRIEQLSKAV
jgi:tetratricopeptide (TPR) repeat protein